MKFRAGQKTPFEQVADRLYELRHRCRALNLPAEILVTFSPDGWRDFMQSKPKDWYIDMLATGSPTLMGSALERRDQEDPVMFWIEAR